MWFLLALHVGAHVFNFERLINSYESSDKLIQILNQFTDTNTTTRLNPIGERGLVCVEASLLFGFVFAMKQNFNILKILFLGPSARAVKNRYLFLQGFVR